MYCDCAASQCALGDKLCFTRNRPILFWYYGTFNLYICGSFKSNVKYVDMYFYDFWIMTYINKNNILNCITLH